MPTFSRRLRLSILLVVALSACPGEPEDKQEEISDVGQACLFSTLPDYPEDTLEEDVFEEDTPVQVQVVLNGCASACLSDIETSCTAELSGTDINVSATASYSVPQGDLDCPAVCVLISATCETPALPAEAYTVSYAGDSLVLDVPSTTATPCVGYAPF